MKKKFIKSLFCVSMAGCVMMANGCAKEEKKDTVVASTEESKEESKEEAVASTAESSEEVVDTTETIETEETQARVIVETSISENGIYELEEQVAYTVDDHTLSYQIVDNGYDYYTYQITVDGVALDLTDVFPADGFYVGTNMMVKNDAGVFCVFDKGYDNDYGEVAVFSFDQGELKLLDVLEASSYEFTEENTMLLRSWEWYFGSHCFNTECVFSEEDLSINCSLMYVYFFEDDDIISYEVLQDVACDAVYDGEKQVSDATMKKGADVYLYAINKKDSEAVFKDVKSGYEYHVTFEETEDFWADENYDDTKGLFWINGVNEADIFGITIMNYAG